MTRPELQGSLFSRSFLTTAGLIVAIFLWASVVPAAAQVATSGTVTGTVVDKTGAVVPGATVTLTDTATKATRTAVTNGSGLYNVTNLDPGTYDITVAKAGFRNYKVGAQPVKIGLPTTVNATLEVGSASQTVEVAATGVELQTTNATIGNTITGVALDSLPSQDRDVSTFVELQPGVSPDGSVAGTVVDQSTFMLDGGNNTNDMDGSMSVYTTSYAAHDPTGGIANQGLGVAAGPTGVMPTPIDSVEEFKVSSALQGADFNSSSGAQVQVVTKRGTNTWHGSAYEYYLDNNFSANTWDNNYTGTPLPNWHYSRFGGSIGGPILPKMLGGKTYFFGMYQGFRWPFTQTIERAVPSENMRNGILTFGGNQYNLQMIDPLGKGISPLVQQMWNKYMPLSNESSCGLSRCDGTNILGFKANMATPQDDNFAVARVDHDFGDKWHFMSSYRYYHLTPVTTRQIDIGGFFPGDKLGVPSATSNNPQVPWYLVAGLTTQISSNTTNDLRYSFLRNYWSWNTNGAPVQIAGLGGALEPFGETNTQVLSPYNVNTQQTRTRFWDGHDWMLKDDVSMLKGKHTFQFGGQYQHNWNYHQRTDNGGGINYYPVYQLGTTSGAGIAMTTGCGAGGMDTCIPAGVPSNQATNFGRDYAATLGIVSISQIAYTRSGANLTLNPPLTPASDQSTIPYYNVYFSDTWKINPRLTLTYGLGWTLEMPPVEKNGKQVVLVDANDKPISVTNYLQQRENAALAGQVYNPTVGFSLIGNVAGHPKYPYNPYYGEFSPRVAAAFDLFGDGNSVLRGGYSRIYGRLNGVDLVLVPLLGTGLIQPVQCFGPLANGNCAGSASASNPSTAFRVGVNGYVAPLPQATQTLPQPLYPGINNIAAGAGEALDPNFRPNVVDSWSVSLQHQMTRNVMVELGYIGRHITHEYQPININAVPYMMTINGQRFDKAYANMVLQYCGGIAGLAGSQCAGNLKAVTPEPFFESTLSASGYCNGYSNCAQAVADKESSNIAIANVWSLWSDLDNGAFNFPRSMLNTPIPGSQYGANGQLTSGVGVNASIGYGNYNAGFVSVKMSDWRGLTMQSNLTWSRALGTGALVQATSADTAVDPFNLATQYGLQAFDRPIIFNLFMVYQKSFYHGSNGFLKQMGSGWTFAPIFVAGSGLPMTLGTANGGGQAFGEGDSVNYFGNGISENAIPIGPIPGSSVHKNVAGYNGIGTSGFGVNIWADPAAVYNMIRQPLLGYDTKDGGIGVLRGLPYWNLDFSLKKNFKITERVNFEAQAVFLNLLNHPVFFDPGFGGSQSNDYLDTSSPSSWGTSPGQGNTPRAMEFGFRVSF